MSIDDPPWPFDQLAVAREVHRIQLGDDPATLRRQGQRLAATLHSCERRERIRRVFLGDEFDDPFEIEPCRLRPQNLEISHVPP